MSATSAVSAADRAAKIGADAKTASTLMSLALTLDPQNEANPTPQHVPEMAQQINRRKMMRSQLRAVQSKRESSVMQMGFKVFNLLRVKRPAILWPKHGRPSLWHAAVLSKSFSKSTSRSCIQCTSCAFSQTAAVCPWLNDLKDFLFSIGHQQ